MHRLQRRVGLVGGREADEAKAFAPASLLVGKVEQNLDMNFASTIIVAELGSGVFSYKMVYK